MKTPKECEGMEDIREAIDSLDTQIVSLIAQRAEYVHEAAKFKKSETAVRDSGRVAQVIESTRQIAEKMGASPVLIEKLYTEMIEFFINEELQEWERARVNN